jgi:hypothetical protein
MMRKLAVLAALVAFVAAAAPASALNPQPLPPKEKSIYLNKYGNVMLNPQPLPPRYRVFGR